MNFFGKQRQTGLFSCKERQGLPIFQTPAFSNYSRELFELGVVAEASAGLLLSSLNKPKKAKELSTTDLLLVSNGSVKSSL